MSLRPLPTSEARRSFAVEVVLRLREAGFQALWAGGCVRDLILGQTPADFDVATDAPPERVLTLFRRTVPVGVSFGVVRVLGPPEAGEVEVATFRTDGEYFDGRRPASVRFGTPEEDASRRDFTINGMFLDPTDGRVLDFVGGQDDLRRGVIRAIGDPVARFEEDKLRLLRAARFAARFDFVLESATRKAILAMASTVQVVAAERIAQELRRMLVHPSRARAMALVQDLGLLVAILPELLPLEGPAGDLWAVALRRLEALPESPGFPLALAALLHDLGVAGGGDAGARDRLAATAENLAARLRLSNAERDGLTWLLAHAHDDLRPGGLPRPRYKRLLSEPGIADLLSLQQAESEATGQGADAVAACRRYLAEQPDGPIDPPPLVTGTDLIALGRNPGPAFKRLLDAVRDAQLAGSIASRAAALDWIRQNAD